MGCLKKKSNALLYSKIKVIWFELNNFWKMIFNLNYKKFEVVHHDIQKSSLIVNAKKDIHPTFYPEAKVYCNGEMVMTLGGSQEKYIVDLWSGNHPFIQGASNTVVVDEGQVNRFKKRFAGLEKFGSLNISTKETN